MTSKKICLVLVLGLALMHGSCNPREVDAAQVGNEDGLEDVSATDRAETTVAITDTAAIIVPADTTGLHKSK